MEGPSLFLAAEQLSPFIGKKINGVGGNTKIGKERLEGKKILNIFSFGKTLIFQFDTFAMRIHFLLFGSFEATVNKKKVTGDYPKKARAPRLSLIMVNGSIEMYSCSIKYLEEGDAKLLYDFSTDIMSDKWNSKQALKKVLRYPRAEIADVLLDQEIFTGVGNIIKNEALLLAKTDPRRKIKDLSPKKLKELIDKIKKFVHQFYEWRKNFVLRKHYQIYKQKKCKVCQGSVIRKITGARKRTSYICEHCEK